LAEGAEIAVIGYHVNDDYSNIFSEARAEYYSMIGLPHVMVDGTHSFDFSYEALLDKYEERIDIASNYSIDIEAEREGTTVNATINVGLIGAPDPETKVLHVVLTESHIPETWYGGDEVNHVERLMIPDHNGTPLVSGKDVNNTFEFEFDIDPTWLVQYCEMVVFLQDTITKEVMQAQTLSLESTVLYNDVAVSDIINPGDDYCLELINPEILITNFGADTLLNCNVNYSVNGEEFSFGWEGNLPMFGTEMVGLPEIAFDLLEENVIVVELGLPNGQEDEDLANNTLEKTFSESQTIELHNLTFELRTDNNANETTWELINSTGEVIYSGSGYENNTLYLIDWILDINDCYTFKIYDSAGNGICCENGLGFYKLKDENDVVYFIGGNFGFQEIATFQIDLGTGISGPVKQNEIAFFPNPVTEEFNIHSPDQLLEVKIYDLNGKILFQQSNVDSRQLKFNVAELETGLYLIQTETEIGIVVEKLLKE